VIPPSTTPQMPGTSTRTSAFITWQVEVPMIASIWPGAIASAAGAVTWASTFPVATAMPSGRPVQAAASAVSVPTLAPSGDSGRPSSRVSAKSAKSGLRAARYSGEG